MISAVTINEVCQGIWGYIPDGGTNEMPLRADQRKTIEGLSGKYHLEAEDIIRATGIPCEACYDNLSSLLEEVFEMMTEFQADFVIRCFRKTFGEEDYRTSVSEAMRVQFGGDEYDL